ncbi:MAG: hypothetical protein ABWY11_02295 [Umezawaea sp.]
MRNRISRRNSTAANVDETTSSQSPTNAVGLNPMSIAAHIDRRT